MCHLFFVKIKKKKSDKVAELVGGGSVIKGAPLSSLYRGGSGDVFALVGIICLFFDKFVSVWHCFFSCHKTT